MTETQISFLLETSEYYGTSLEDLQDIFPEVDWSAEQSKRREAEKVERANRPPSNVNTLQLDAILKEFYGPKLEDWVNQKNPLVEYLKRK